MKKLLLIMFCFQAANSRLIAVDDKKALGGTVDSVRKDLRDLKSIKSESVVDGSVEQESVKAKSLGKELFPKGKSQRNEMIELRLENTSIASIVSHLANLKGINIIPNKEAAEKKISFMCKKKLTIDQAWDIMLTLMQVHGYTIVQNGEVYKVVVAKDAPGEPYRVFSSKNPYQLPNTDEIVTLIYYPVNMKADQISEIFGAIVGEKTKPLSDLEICIVTGRSSKIKNALEIIEPLDKEQLKQDIKIVQLKFTKPEEVARLLNEELVNAKNNDGQRILIRSGGKKDVTYFSSSVKIIPDPGKQTLILLGQKKQIDKVAEFVEQVLDMKLESTNSKPIKIYEVKYRDANELSKMLLKIIKIAQQGAQSTKSVPFKDAQIVPTGGNSSSGDGSSSGCGNKLLISCDNTDFPKLLSLIENLDTLKPQIVLEAMVVNASDTLNRYLEGHIRDTGRNIIGEKTGWLFANVGNVADIKDDWNGLGKSLLAVTGAGESDSTLITFGDPNKADAGGNLSNLWGYLYAAVTKTRSNLISQPFTIVNNNEETTFNSTDTRTLPSESQVRGQVAMKTFKPVSASHSITVTPMVNADGIVQMKIEVQVADFEAGDSGATPNMLSRTVTTKVSMNLGEVLFLGGLSKNKIDGKRTGVPILGELPLLGNFFKSKERSQNQQFLYLFIRPSLIKPRFDDEPDAYTRLKMDYAKLNIKRSDSLIKTKDPVEKFFFRPSNVSSEQIDSYQKNDYYSDIDDFWQKKNSPVSADIVRDTYFRSNVSGLESYEKVASGKKSLPQADSLTSKFKKQRPVIV